MGELEIRRLTEPELPEFREFCELHWGGRHNLIHDEAMFRRYYRRGETIDFLAARDGGELCGVCGFIPSNSLPSPDVWISYILAKKGAPAALGFKLLEAVKQTTGCRSLGCNNVRKKVRGLYEFLGYSFGEMPHWYRLNPELSNYTVCNISDRIILPVADAGSVTFSVCRDRKELDRFEFEKYIQYRPYKDRAYVERRFFADPRWNAYRCVFAAQDGVVRALLVVRAIEASSGRVLRVVDFVGDREILPACGAYLDEAVRKERFQYCDWYAAGPSDEMMEKAGFVKAGADGANILPYFLEPPVAENLAIYSVTDGADYWMFRADGDQDRPDIKV